MPSKNRVKQFIENGSYHIYNRGVNRQKIFLCDEDYSVYLRYVEQYLLPPRILYQQLLDRKARNAEIVRVLLLKNYSESINLMAYCLMPNHIHLIIEQTSSRVISEFMQSLHTRYAMYLNRKYKRIGCLFEDIYKARSIRDATDILDMSLYVHRNPIKLTTRLETYKWSSLHYYCDNQEILWLKKEKVVKAFRKSPLRRQFRNYKDLVKARP